ncbi:HPF/RaiA family ribosome-associated protein [Acidovorax lacteus]|uniref:HPF/RaiA family ribosome-associated protein n=1 Tax=Acidovorax lacteus TaxID=1924988 RepID=A0ABP8L409_9BURK
MQLMFKSRVRDAQPLRPWALARVSFVLRRLAWRAQTATVRLEDVDGPRHGLDKRCSVAIQSGDTPPVLVSATARDWTTALNIALARAAQTWKRLLQRQRDSRRRARSFARGQATALPRA